MKIYAINVACHPDFGGVSFVHRAYTSKDALHAEINRLIDDEDMMFYNGGNVGGRDDVEFIFDNEPPDDCQFFWHEQWLQKYECDEELMADVANVWISEFDAE
jgi:hypothetical protein